MLSVWKIVEEGWTWALDEALDIQLNNGNRPKQSPGISWAAGIGSGFSRKTSSSPAAARRPERSRCRKLDTDTARRCSIARAPHIHAESSVTVAQVTAWVPRPSFSVQPLRGLTPREIRGG